MTDSVDDEIPGFAEEKAGRLDAQRLSDFAEAGSDWFFELDRNFQFTYVSAGYGDGFDGVPPVIIGRSYWDVHQTNESVLEDELWQHHRAMMESHQPWRDFTFTRVGEGQQRCLISSSAIPIQDEEGQFAGYRGAERDITGRALVEAQLNAIVNAVPDAIITIDEKGIVASFSKPSEALFGYTSSEVVGQNVKLLMPQPYHDEHDGYLSRYLRTGEKRIVGIGREVEARKKDGTVFPIHLSVNEMTVAGERLFTGIIHDASELNKVRSLNSRFGEILDHSLNEIYLFDAETLKFVLVNSGARNNLGYSNHELRNMQPADIKPEFTNQQFDLLLEPLRNGEKERLVFKTRHRRKDETTYPVEVHLQLMRRGMAPIFLAIIQDITEMERREAQLRQSQKMEAVGQLTGGIAHDFNNLLTVIIGNHELLGDLISEELPRALLDDATSAAEHAAQLTSRLLAFARQQPLAPQIIDLNALIEEMSDMLERTLGGNVRLRSILDSELRPTLADPAQVHNAILNLTINARDAMPEGGDLIIETSNVDIDADAASIRSEASPGRYVRLSVRDTGSGMSVETQARILEPFFTTKEPGKGTGLGLSMVHGFAKQSGGFMEVYSELDFGTAISFYLPDAEDVAESAADDDSSSNQSTNSSKTVLVVEDDERVLAITLKRLDHLGYRTIAAESGKQALDVLLEGREVDLVFSDMVMPGGMSGGELLDEVKTRFPHIKTLITSGYSEDGLIPNHGARWLRKPYSIQQLANAIRDILSG